MSPLLDISSMWNSMQYQNSYSITAVNDKFKQINTTVQSLVFDSVRLTTVTPKVLSFYSKKNRADKEAAIAKQIQDNRKIVSATTTATPSTSTTPTTQSTKSETPTATEELSSSATTTKVETTSSATASKTNVETTSTATASTTNVEIASTATASKTNVETASSATASKTNVETASSATASKTNVETASSATASKTNEKTSTTASKKTSSYFLKQAVAWQTAYMAIQTITPSTTYGRSGFDLIGSSLNLKA